MKKILTGILAFTAFAFSATAQDSSSMKHHSFHHRGSMMKGVNLTADQKAQMKTNVESTKSQLAELNKNEDITVREYKAKKAAIMKSQKDKMDQLLTPEQKTQMAQNKQDRQARLEKFSAKRMEKMKATLNLSDDQVAKLKSNREAAFAKLKSIRENDQLSPSDKKEQVMAVIKEQKSSFKEVLTPDQLSKMEQMRKSRMDKQSGK